MHPWFVFWAPQLTLPFGGSVAQNIEPNVRWFFDSIAPTAGDATIERQAFEVASSGRQLGLITEVRADLAATTPPKTARGRRSLQRLHEIQERVEQLKQKDATELLAEIDALLLRLKQHHAERLPQARERIERALAADGA
jgi:hypothetical protein